MDDYAVPSAGSDGFKITGATFSGNVAAREVQVEGELRRVEDAQSVLAETIAQLDERLHAVSRSHDMELAAARLAEVEEESLVPMAERIRSHRRGLTNMLDRVQGMIARLEV